MLENRAMANFCSACGAAVSPNARYCANCGSVLEDVQPREPEPDPELVPEPPPARRRAFAVFLDDLERAVLGAARWVLRVDELKAALDRRRRRVRLDKTDSEPTESDKKQNMGKRIGVGCGLALGAVFLLLILASMCIPDDDTETPARQATALCDRPAEAAYLRDIDSAMNSVEAGGADVSRLFAELATGNITARMLEDLNMGLAVVRDGADEILGLQAPDSLSQIDSEAKRMARELRASTGLYEDALRDGDGIALREGTTRINNATGYMESMMETWARVCGL